MEQQRERAALWQINGGGGDVGGGGVGGVGGPEPPVQQRCCPCQDAMKPGWWGWCTSTKGLEMAPRQHMMPSKSHVQLGNLAVISIIDESTD